MAAIPDGVYKIQLPHGNSFITDPGEGRFLHLLPDEALGKNADKIKVTYNSERGAYSLQFEKSKKYLTFEREPSRNNKLVDGDKPRYFKIDKHSYYADHYAIYVAEDRQFHLGMAMERIYPPWVAMQNFPDIQPWKFDKA
ncbi:unnamed protein product [Rhizoctonia solani]|uniref:Uncharacterized protein n=1 Tax=Rhizoctonia solani TaxID=456999 RepID=A0A8H3BM45_9AGAM|nr:unnamed protein product [Rhizoctonia solani]